MTKNERLAKMKATYEVKVAEYKEVEKKLGAYTETVPMYEGGSRYDMAFPGHDKIIGYREIVRYAHPEYLYLRNALVNELDRLETRIRNLTEKM